MSGKGVNTPVFQRNQGNVASKPVSRHQVRPRSTFSSHSSAILETNKCNLFGISDFHLRSLDLSCRGDSLGRGKLSESELFI